MRVLPVSGGRDEVDTGVDSSVGNDLLSVDADLLIEVFVKLLIHVLQNRSPAADNGQSDHTPSHPQPSHSLTIYHC